MNTNSTRPPLQLTINGAKHNWHEEYITGHQLKQLGNLTDETPLFLVIEAPWENELILNETRVNLARPGIEAFVSKHKHPDAIILTIETPKGKWQNGAFDKSLTVQALIQKVVKKFEFDADGHYKLKIKGHEESLDPTLTLEAAHLKDNMILVFTDLGKGANR